MLTTPPRTARLSIPTLGDVMAVLDANEPWVLVDGEPVEDMTDAAYGELCKAVTAEIKKDEPENACDCRALVRRRLLGIACPYCRTYDIA